MAPTRTTNPSIRVVGSNNLPLYVRGLHRSFYLDRFDRSAIVEQLRTSTELDDLAA